MRWWLTILVLGLASGCATYKPAPLEPAAAQQQFESRTFSSPGLCEYLRNNLRFQSTCPPWEWNPEALTLTAFYYNPQLAVAEAQVAQADAAVITAGASPNPTVGLGPQYDVRAASFTPWAIGSFNLRVPIETAGKRGYRLARAEQLADAARLSLGEAGWVVRTRVRAALVDYMLAVRQNEVASGQQAALAQTVELLRQRLDAGAASQPELDFATGVLQSAIVKAAQARAQVPRARNVLAAALGLPVEALEGAKFSWADVDSPGDTAFSSPAAIQRAALLNRLDLRRALVQYAAADEALKLEIAKQYPDLNLFGGYTWEGGENLFELGPSIVLPVLNQNQGPIAEAEARRKELAAQFVALQAAIIAEARGALVRYQGALEALQAARAAANSQTRRLDQVRRAAAVGEADALLLVQAKLQKMGADQSMVEALGNAQAAFGALEDSVQRPLDPHPASFSFPIRATTEPDKQ